MSMQEMSVSDARADLREVTNRAEYTGATTYLTKHGHRAAAVVPAESAQLLEEIEELVDTEAVRQALAEHEAGANDRVPYTRRTGQ